jgi:hypothetical protein
MGKLALVTKLGSFDAGVDLGNNSYLKTANLEILNDRATISDRFLHRLKQLGLRPSETAMDLWVVACSMYAADTRIKRRQFAEDSWTRLIDLYVPVSDPNLWNAQKELLEKIFRFLTGDIWTIFFRSRTNMPVTSPYSKLRRFKMPYRTDTVCLFSGGMDSFIGTVDLLEKKVRPLLVGHSKSADVTPYQSKCALSLNSYYSQFSPERVYAFIRVANKKHFFGGIENTERGRSFMFLTLGALCASSLSSSSSLIIPENGMISLNIPLTPLRVGSHSTRTTHPFYLSMMQELLSNIGLNVTLKNPYQFKTKGEMLAECMNSKLVAKTETMSCSHPAAGRYKGGVGSSNRHCGYCVPCIIRQAAFMAAGISDILPYSNNLHKQLLKISKAEGADVIAFKYMIEKVKLHPNYLTAAIRNTGPLGENVQPYINVYERALNEVDHFLNRVKLT